MINIRPAEEKDAAAVLVLLRELDIISSSQSLQDFWLAESGGEIAAVLQLSDRGEFLFLSSLGVAEKHEKKGLAAQLIKKVLSTARKDVYLYTVIPEFFRKFGFAPAAPPLPRLPSKDALECETCTPEKCVCLVRRAG